VVEKSGAWFSFDSQRIGQGRENAKAFLRDHPEVAAKIEERIRAQAGMVANALMAEGGEEAEAAE
jgi:recombination protein RecA